MEPAGIEPTTSGTAETPESGIRRSANELRPLPNLELKSKKSAGQLNPLV